MSLTAKVAVQLLRDGARVVIAAGEPLPDLSAIEARDLVAAGALAYPPTEFSSSSDPEEARAGAGNPGTNTPGEAVAEGGVDSTPSGAVITGDGSGEPLPELPPTAYAPDAVQLDTSPARPDESVPELARETEPAAAAARKPRSK